MSRFWCNLVLSLIWKRLDDLGVLFRLLALLTTSNGVIAFTRTSGWIVPFGGNMASYVAICSRIYIYYKVRKHLCSDADALPATGPKARFDTVRDPASLEDPQQTCLYTSYKH